MKDLLLACALVALAMVVALTITIATQNCANDGGKLVRSTSFNKIECVK